MSTYKLKALLTTAMVAVTLICSSIHSMDSSKPLISPSNRPKSKEAYEELQRRSDSDPNAQKVLKDFGNFQMNVQQAQLAVSAYNNLLMQASGHGGKGTVSRGLFSENSKENTNSPTQEGSKGKLHVTKPQPAQSQQTESVSSLERKFKEAIDNGEVENAELIFDQAISEIHEKTVIADMNNTLKNARVKESIKSRPKVKFDVPVLKKLQESHKQKVFADPRRDLIIDFVDGATIDRHGEYTNWGLLKILQQTGIVVKGFHGMPLSALNANDLIKDLRIVPGGAFSDKIYIVTLKEEYLTPEHKKNNRYAIKNAVQATDLDLIKQTGNTHPLKEMRDLDLVNQIILTKKLGKNPLNHATLMGIGNSCFYVYFSNDGRSEKQYVVVLDAAEGEPIGALYDRYRGHTQDGSLIGESERIDQKAWDKIIYDLGMALGDVHIKLAKDKDKEYILHDSHATLKQFKTILLGDCHLENAIYNHKSTDGKPITFIDIASMAHSFNKSPFQFDEHTNKKPDIIFLFNWCQAWGVEINWDAFSEGYAQNFGSNDKLIETELKEYFKTHRQGAAKSHLAGKEFILFWGTHVEHEDWSPKYLKEVKEAWEKLPLDQKWGFIEYDIITENKNEDKAIKNAKYLIDHILSPNDKSQIIKLPEFSMLLALASQEVQKLFNLAFGSHTGEPLKRETSKVRKSGIPSSRPTSKTFSIKSTASLKDKSEEFWHNWDNNKLNECKELWAQLEHSAQDAILKKIMVENKIEKIHALFNSIIPTDMDKAAMFEVGQKLANEDFDVSYALMGGDSDDVLNFFQQLSPYENAVPKVSKEIDDFRFAWLNATAEELFNLWKHLSEPDQITVLTDLIFTTPLTDLEWFFHEVVSSHGEAVFQEAKKIALSHKNSSAISDENWDYLLSDHLPPTSVPSEGPHTSSPKTSGTITSPSTGGRKSHDPSTKASKTATTSTTTSKNNTNDATKSPHNKPAEAGTVHPPMKVLSMDLSKELKRQLTQPQLEKRKNAIAELESKGTPKNELPAEIKDIFGSKGKTIVDYGLLVDEINKIFEQYSTETDTNLKSKHAGILSELFNKVSINKELNEIYRLALSSKEKGVSKLALEKRKLKDSIEEKLLTMGWTNENDKLLPPK